MFRISLFFLVVTAGCGLVGNRTGRGGGSGGFGASSPTEITGHINFQPALDDADGTSISATGSQGTTPGTVAPNGDFLIYPLAAGTYTLTASRPHYATATVSGVVVAAGGQTQVQPITLIADSGSSGSTGSTSGTGSTGGTTGGDGGH